MNYRSRFTQLLFSLSVLISSKALALGASGTIENFALDSCGKTTCVRVESQKASVGAFDGSIGSGEAKVTITNKTSGAISVIISKDVYFDQSANKIYIRTIADQPNSEYYFDLWTETLVRFAL